MLADGVRVLRHGPFGCPGDRGGEAAGVRGSASAAANGDRVPGGREGVPGLRGDGRGRGPVEATSLVQYGPVMHAKAALAACAHYLLVARAAKLVAAYTGVPVFAGSWPGSGARPRAGWARSWTGPAACAQCLSGARQVRRPRAG
jgi:hypothetical protein